MKISPDRQECAHGHAVIAERAQALLDEIHQLWHRPGRKSIHDTRVKSRRLRAALEAYQDLFPPKAWKAVNGQIQDITRILGKPRETEVNLSLVRRMGGGGDMAENLCLEYLEERLRSRLKKRVRKMHRKLRVLREDRIRAKTRTLLQKLPGANKAADPLPADGPPAAAEAPSRSRRRNPSQPTLFELEGAPGERAVRALADLAQPILQFDLRGRFREASDPELHQLRIAAKKLRYAMEVFDPVWPGGLKRPIRLAKELQDAGGLYHDWCVLSAKLQNEIQRLTDQNSTHMAFQAGRLLAGVNDRRSELRTKMLLPVRRLQRAVRALLPEAPAASHDTDRTPAGGQSPKSSSS